jgi:HSP20 family molecular chaperone IbpA
MVRKDFRGRKVKDLAEIASHLEAEDLIRNFDEEMSRLEHGLGHMVYDLQENRVTTWLRPLPVTPRFDVDESESEFKLKVTLPNISKENVRLNVDKKSVELFACSDDAICRPRYIAIDVAGTLDPDSAKAKMTGDTFELKVSKVRKKRLKIK